VRLGWSHGDQEIFSEAELISLFDLPSIGRSPARFDFAKLENLNGHYMRASDDATLAAAFEQVLPYVPGGPEIAAQLNAKTRAQLVQAMPGLKERAKTLVELVDSSAFIFAARPLKLDHKAAAVMTPDTRKLVNDIAEQLQPVAPWNAETTEAAIRELAEKSGLKLGAIAQPLRAALTGRTTSPGIFDVLAVLGKDECLGRLKDLATP
jgi:glutamyl-tRNA synthetase